MYINIIIRNKIYEIKMLSTVCRPKRYVFNCFLKLLTSHIKRGPINNKLMLRLSERQKLLQMI